MSQDREHLRLLSIFHYVVGAICGVFAMFPVIHLILGVALATGALDDGSRDAPPREFGWAIVVMAGCFILMGLIMAGCIVVAGRRLSQHRSHTYCLVIAAIECTFMPFGTALGVFTLVTLTRPSVKELFDSHVQQEEFSGR